MFTASSSSGTRARKDARALRRSRPTAGPSGTSSNVERAGDGLLIALFLALTFLLGVFPLKDADFYWHLRTGDLIRQTGAVPRVDPFTYTRAGVPWVDLHWGFQVAVSWVHERGGVVGLNLAKCVVTCVAVALLVTSGRREWPVWVRLLAWLPAILLMAGRMYIRPETLTLLYLSMFLAVLARRDSSPRLMWVLPFVSVVWVNSHGLFVLGPIVLAVALVNDAIRQWLAPGDRRAPGWWRLVSLASVATIAACVLNPYGLRGALFPIELVRSLANPSMKQNVSELTPVPVFIARSGAGGLPLQLYGLTLLLGAASFVVPLVRRGTAPESPLADAQGLVSAPPVTRASRETMKAVLARVSPFRLMLFLAFAVLSLLATRNSYPFAAVAGTVTAWNFGEWAGRFPAPWRTGFRPRVITAAVIGVAIGWVGSGKFYAMTGEGRRVSLGEAPLYYPHAAVKFAGRPGMPERFISFPNAHASLFEYEYGPARKVFTDPRLEVAGVEVFERYIRLARRIKEGRPGWEADLDVIGRPVILVDHEDNSESVAVLLRNSRWRCVWFDPIAALFVHESYADVVVEHEVDFAARHFRPDPAAPPLGLNERLALAKALRNDIGATPPSRVALVRSLSWLGLDEARAVVRLDPNSAEGWKCLGQVELLREPTPPRVPRYRLPFDPVLDLPTVRATYALRRALELAPRDFTALMTLEQAYESRLMNESAVTLLDRLVTLRPNDPFQANLQRLAESARAEFRDKLGPPPPLSWRDPKTNWGKPDDLNEAIDVVVRSNRDATAADLLGRVRPSWHASDRAATLRLHLGEPGRARALWANAPAPPDPALRPARLAATSLAEGDFDTARTAYQQSLTHNPNGFEARYGLAILEEDAGHAPLASEHALKAVPAAPDDASRRAAQAIAQRVAPFRNEP